MRGSLLGDLVASILQPARPRVPSPIVEPGGDLARPARELLGARGQVSGVAIARTMLDAYGRLDPSGRKAFFLMLASELEADPEVCLRAAELLHADPSPASFAAMRAAAEPPRQELLRRLNLAPGGTEALVRMRRDLLELLPREPSLAGVDDDFLHLFSSWFNRGFLVLRRIDWTSPAALLEKIIAYEAVHEIAGWPDLRRRVEPQDRLCYAFFHPAMPDEPLIVIEVALTLAVPERIDALLAEERATVSRERAKVACFYSISNCQPGLRGVSFGNFLIKQVVSELASAFPTLSTFVTLSPIPGFAAWYRDHMPGKSPETEDALAMQAHAARYLARERRADGQPCDAVARFHLGNGARLEAIRADADRSERGRAQSFGLMVNYLYDLATVESNHEAFRNDGRVVMGKAVSSLLGGNKNDKAKRWPILSTTH